MARGATQTVNITHVGTTRRRLAKGNCRVVLSQGVTVNYVTRSSSLRKFTIVR